METSANVETINNLLNVETYLSLLMDVAVQQSPGIDGSDGRREGEQMPRLHDLSRRQID